MLPTQHVKQATILALALGATVPMAASAKPIGPDPAPFTAQTTPIVHITTPPPAALTGETPASAPPAASPSRCSESAERFWSHNAAHATPTVPPGRPTDRPGLRIDTTSASASNHRVGSPPRIRRGCTLVAATITAVRHREPAGVEVAFRQPSSNAVPHASL